MKCHDFCPLFWPAPLNLTICFCFLFCVYCRYSSTRIPSLTNKIQHPNLLPWRHARFMTIKRHKGFQIEKVARESFVCCSYTCYILVRQGKYEQLPPSYFGQLLPRTLSSSARSNESGMTVSKNPLSGVLGISSSPGRSLMGSSSTSSSMGSWEIAS